MKKLLSIFLAIAMCLALFACADQSDASSTNTSETVSAVTSDNESATTSPASSDETSISTASPAAGVAGYLEDEVDHYARDTYEIVYLSEVFQFLQQSWFAAMEQMEERFNINMTYVGGEGSQDTYLTNLELLASRGYDGVIVDCPTPIQARAIELLEESGLPHIAFIQLLLDDNKQTVAPSIILDQYTAGAMTMEWLIANYSSDAYFGDIDTSKLGAIDIGMTSSVDLMARSEGPERLFKEAFPDSQFFFMDAVASGGITPDAAYAIVSATIAAHPEVEYWFVTGCVEFFGTGAARAIDDLGKADKCMVCVVGHGVNIVDWQSMPEDAISANVACLMTSDLLYAAPAIAGIVALIDGRSTQETLWINETPPNYQYGNTYGVWVNDGEIVTRWDYQDYIDRTNALVLGN